MLLSGHRPTTIKETRWEDLYVAERRLRIPNPKGGRTRAFDMPLSRPTLRILNEAKRAGEMMHADHAEEWIFPSAVGHVVEHKQTILTATHKALRHTYGAIAESVKTPRLFKKLLMNHSVSSDVTDAYSANSSSFSDLVKWQEKISGALISKCAQSDS